MRLTSILRRLMGALFLTSFAMPASAAAELSAPDVGSPRAAMTRFLAECRAGEYSDAATLLDLEALPAERRAADGPRYARHLKVVLDRTLWVDLDALSPDPEGRTDDGLPEGVDRVGTIATPRGSVDVLLRRVTRADGAPAWRLDRSIVSKIPALYAEFGYGRLGEWLPESFFTLQLLEIALWQWLGLGLWIIVAWLAGLVGTLLLTRIAQPIVHRTSVTWDDRLVSLLTAPVRAAVALAVFSMGTLALRLSIPVRDVLSAVEGALAIGVGTWMLARCVRLVGDVLSARLVAENRRGLVSSVTLARKVAQAALVAMAAVALLHAVGVNVTGVVAGLGVGGLAVALAAQKTVENLFGGLTLASDQPVRVGDFCRWGERVGTVEEIGLRSTRIRTLDRTVVTVPNSVLSQLELENFAKRDRIRLHTVIGVRYETSPDQLRFLLAEIRNILVGHPMVTREPARVRFTGFGASSLDLEIFAYIATSEYDEFLRVREDIFLRVMDVVGSAGSGFAFPSRTVYFGRDGGLDEKKSFAAEMAVKALREQGDLPVPDPAPETLVALENTLDWPPRGTAAAKRSRDATEPVVHGDA